MTISQNGKSWKWRNFTSGSSKRWAVSSLLTWSSAGVLPILWWDRSLSLTCTVGCSASLLQWQSPLSWESRPPTGSAPQRPSTSWCRSLRLTVLTCVAQSRSTSPCGGMMSVANWIPTATHFPKWLSTTWLLRCPKHTLALTILSIEMSAYNNTPHYLN